MIKEIKLDLEARSQNNERQEESCGLFGLKTDDMS